MKKCSIALAVLAVSATAAAQSSVTIFGIVDTAVSHYSVKSVPYGVAPLANPQQFAAARQRSQTALSSGGMLPSRLGFRGTEDLGGGLAAGFWLEGPMSNDDGATPLNFTRRSTLSLSGSFGELRVGRDYTPTFWLQTLFDPFSNSGVGSSAIGSVSANLNRIAALAGGGPLNPNTTGGAADNYARASNMIGYVLPPNLGGFYGQAQFSLHENTKESELPGSPSRRGHNQGFRLGYANGPLDVAMSYTQSIAIDAVLPTGAATERKIANANFGASYDFGAAKLFTQLSRVQDRSSASVPIAFGALSSDTRDTYTGALVGVTVPVGPGVIRASYAHVKFKDDAGAVPRNPFAPDPDASLSKFAVGYVHNLSKRTALYATVARIRIRNGQNNPVMAIATGGAATYLSSGNALGGYAPRSATGYDFGIQHVF